MMSQEKQLAADAAVSIDGRGDQRTGAALAPALYIVGGRQRKARPLLGQNEAWSDFEMAVIHRLDTRTGVAKSLVEYTSPGDVVPEGDSILFKSGTVHDGKLYICTQTEVFIYSFPAMEQLTRLSLPCFNDVHHVRPTPEGNLLIANSGLEMVVEVSLAGEVLRAWNTLGEAPWERFSKDSDYRKADLKPHKSHPNHVFYLGDEPWATRFHQKDAISLTDPGRRIPINLERPHDGYVHNGRVYFTTVDGKVVIANATSLAIEEVVDLAAIHQDDVILGWCRGLTFDGKYTWIGYTRIRPTKWRENVSWVAHGFKRACPTHVACYDLASRTCVADFNVEDYGLNAVFGVYLEPSRAGEGDVSEP